jgi:Flp pilus assembly protein TadG
MRRSTGHRRRGAAACELAILLPFLALMFAFAVDYCRVFYYTQTVEGCAHAGALYASGAATRGPGVSATDAARQAAVAEGVSLNPPLAAENVSVSITGSTASLTVTYVFQTLTTYPGASGPVTLTRTVTMPLLPKAPGAP